LNDKIFQPSQY